MRFPYNYEGFPPGVSRSFRAARTLSALLANALRRPARIGLILMLATAGALFSGAGVRAELDPGVTNQVLPSVVQLGPAVEVTTSTGTEVRYFPWGSGTIVSATGHILTNHHVTDLASVREQIEDPGMKLLEGMLAVLITRSADEPPIASYLAEVQADSAHLDLAVLRITQDLGRKPVNPESLQLPFVPLGDSEQVNLAQAVYIFGYPAIGGQTITYTEGAVSGFSAEDGVQGRAWIKTDASISGGNSGGTAIAGDGTLIGVPTRGGGGGTTEPLVDCRSVTDTNGDGSVNAEDTCVPVGGFINSLRPVNLARPLIEQAMSGQGAGPDVPQASSGVRLSGTVTDAGTNLPLPGVVFAVLAEGTDWSDYNSAPNADKVHEAIRTDERGRFVMNTALKRGSTYSLGLIAAGYQAQAADGIAIPEELPDLQDMGVLQMQRE